MAPLRQRSSPTGQERDRKIGRRVAHLRLEQDLSMEELGARCEPKATGSQINKIEKGKMKALTMDWVYRLANALEVNVLELTEPLPEDEWRLLTRYRELGEAGRETVFRVAEAAAQSDLRKRSNG